MPPSSYHAGGAGFHDQYAPNSTTNLPKSSSRGYGPSRGANMLPPVSSSTNIRDSEMDDEGWGGGQGGLGAAGASLMAQKRCEMPEISSKFEKQVYLNESISIIMKDQDKMSFMESRRLNPLNDRNSIALKFRDVLRSQQNIDPKSVQFDKKLPPPLYAKSYIMYTINSDMLPTYCNGIRVDAE